MGRATVDFSRLAITPLALPPSLCLVEGDSWRHFPPKLALFDYIPPLSCTQTPGTSMGGTPVRNLGGIHFKQRRARPPVRNWISSAKPDPSSDAAEPSKAGENEAVWTNYLWPRLSFAPFLRIREHA